MNKKQFLKELEESLQGLPKDDIEERLAFYSEMIDDRVEEGLSEEEAVYDIGGTDKAVQQIVKETPMTTLVKERIRPKRKIRGFEILLLVLGFPLWFPLLMVGVILFMVFVMLTWIMVIVTYSVEVALCSVTIAGAARFLIELYHGNFHMGYLGISVLGAGAVLIFLAVCVLATKANAKLSYKIVSGIKRKLIGGKKNA